MQIVDLDEVDDLPFSVLARWFDAEQEVPFLDRRIELTAYLMCRVLHAVIQHAVVPDPEMFVLSPLPEQSAPDADFPEVDQRSIDLFAEKIQHWQGSDDGGGEH